VTEDTARRIFLLAANTFNNGEHVTLAFDQIALIEIGNNRGRAVT